MSNSADAWIVCVRVDVETTDADQAVGAPSEHEGFPWTVEPILPGRPLVTEPPEKSPTRRFALGHEWLELDRRRQTHGAFDGQAHAPSRCPTTVR